MAIAGADYSSQKRCRICRSSVFVRILTSILSSIVINLQNGIEKALKYMAEWEGMSPDDVNVELNMDFVDVRIPHKNYRPGTVQMGGISMDTLLHNETG